MRKGISDASSQKKLAKKANIAGYPFCAIEESLQRQSLLPFYFSCKEAGLVTIDLFYLS